jgi:hypothetical protein
MRRLKVMGEPEAKASGLISWTRVLRKSVDSARWSRFLAALPPEARALVEKPPLPITWLPMKLVRPIFERANDLLLDDDLEKVADVSRRQISEDLSTIYRVFIRVASPRFVVSRASVIYSTYFRNNGSARVVAETERSVDILVEDVALPSPDLYARMRGSILGGIELTGARSPRVQIVSGGGSEPSCLLRADWQ